MKEPIYIVKYEYNHYLSGYTKSIIHYETLKEALDYYIGLNRDNSCFDDSFKKSIHKIILDETNQIKELIMENL